MLPRRAGRRWVFPVTLSVGALLVGGVLLLLHKPPAPPSEDKIGTLHSFFQSELTDWNVALHDAGNASAEEEAFRKKTATLDPPLPDLFGRLATAHRAAAHATRGHNEADGLATALDAINSALLKARYPFYMDGEVVAQGGRNYAIVFAFAIQKTVTFGTPDGPVQALYLKRVDRMNWRYKMVAYAQSDRKEVSVLTEHVELLLSSQVLPALGPDAFRPLWTEEEAPLSEPLRVLAADTAAAVAEEIGKARDPKALQALRERFSFSLARHEVQHVLDNRAEGRKMNRARAELSAYLGELARPGGMPNLSLGLLFGYALDREPSAEGEAAKILLGEMARELALKGNDDIELYTALVKTPADARRKAARAAWERLFKKPLPEITSSP